LSKKSTMQPGATLNFNRPFEAEGRRKGHTIVNESGQSTDYTSGEAFPKCSGDRRICESMSREMERKVRTVCLDRSGS
jgi:hypothetical protein